MNNLYVVTRYNKDGFLAGTIPTEWMEKLQESILAAAMVDRSSVEWYGGVLTLGKYVDLYWKPKTNSKEVYITIANRFAHLLKIGWPLTLGPSLADLGMMRYSTRAFFRAKHSWLKEIYPKQSQALNAAKLQFGMYPVDDEPKPIHFPSKAFGPQHDHPASKFYGNIKNGPLAGHKMQDAKKFLGLQSDYVGPDIPDLQPKIIDLNHLKATPEQIESFKSIYEKLNDHKPKTKKYNPNFPFLEETSPWNITIKPAVEITPSGYLVDVSDIHPNFPSITIYDQPNPGPNPPDPPASGSDGGSAGAGHHPVSGPCNDESGC